MTRFVLSRIKHSRRSPWAEEFLVRWELETCTFREALKQYKLDFDPTLITSLEVGVPSYTLQAFVIAKHSNRNNGAPSADHPFPHLALCCFPLLRKIRSTFEPSRMVLERLTLSWQRKHNPRRRLAVRMASSHARLPLN